MPYPMLLTDNGVRFSLQTLLHPLFGTIPENILYPLSTDISEILSFTKTQYFNYENIFVFTSNVPTPSTDKFTLFKSHSLPIFINLIENKKLPFVFKHKTLL